MKKITFLGLCILTVGCSSFNSMPDQAREPAQISESDCQAGFQSATQRLIILINKNSADFSENFAKKIQNRMKDSKVICVDENVTPHGFRVNMANSQITIENNLTSVSKLLESKSGKEMMSKFEINERQAFYDRLLVSIVSECYAELLGEAGPDYENFFQTLKASQK